jgi:hypothetical protein
VFALIANVHVATLLPLHAPPDHAVNAAFAPGTAINVIDVPLANDVPLGVCVIVPDPTTAVASVYFGAAANVAVTVVFAVIVNVHFAAVLPLHAPPDHAVNVAPALGTAVNVIDVPLENEVPVGVCMIVPGPTAAVVSV